MNNFSALLIFSIGFLWIVLGSNQIARFFQKIRLPLITGFLFSGIIAGPFVLKLIPSESLEHLHFINDFSLAYIAFAAGAELYLKEIRSSFKSIVWNTFGQLIVTFLVGTLAVYLLANNIPFMRSMNENLKIAVSILAGSVFVARSPSSAIAVINEMRAKGKFSKTVMGVTVIKDVLVILLFAICLSISVTLVQDTPFDTTFIFVLLFELLLTFVFGYLLYLIFNQILAFRIHSSIKTIVLLGQGLVVFLGLRYFSEYSKSHLPFEIMIEPLLVCITASFLVVNRGKYRIEFQSIIDKSGPYIYAAFFTLAGAMMSVDILIKTWQIAVLFFGIRLIGVFIGSSVGTYLAGDPRLFRRIGWMPYITQAGVGFALALDITTVFPGWGDELATIIIAMIVLNQLIGPPLFKWAIKLAGESHLPAKEEYDHSKRAIIFGYENQSIALARELIQQDWQMTIVSINEADSTEDIEDITLKTIPDFEDKTLKSLKLKEYDTMVLLMSDKKNFRICEWIYEHVGKKIVIVRLNDRTNLKHFYELGALVVDPATAFVNLLQHFVRSPMATSLLLGMEPDKDTIDLKVSDPQLHGVALRNLRLPSDVLILSVKRKGQMLISHGHTRLRIGDIVTMVGSLQSLEKVSLQFSPSLIKRTDI